MKLASEILVAFVAIEHIYILWLEMFAWTTKARKVFRTIPPEMFEPTKVFAANQGLYNGFLAAGLIWSIFIQDINWSNYVAIFFLSCVFIAGVYGGATAGKSIFIKQGVPALIGLIVTVITTLQ